MKSILLGLICLLLLPQSLWAGVHAQIRTDLHQSGQSHVLNGEFFSQGDKIRVDQTLVGLAQSTIVDFFSNKVIVLLHSRKVFVQSNLDDSAWRNFMMRGQIPKPEKSKGAGVEIRFLREETFEKHPCRVVEVSWQGTSKTKTLLWQAKDLEGVVLKSETQRADGMQQTTHLYNIQLEKIDESLFTPPVDYSRSSESVVGFDAPHS